MTDIIARFIPIFLIIASGALFRSLGILNDTVADGIKKLIINFGLPSVLFLSFLTMELKSSYLLLFGSVILLCLLLYGFGRLLRDLKVLEDALAPFFLTGFEFGMVGVALFSSLFGMENLHYILLLGLGHELFIWFFYAPLLQARNHGSVEPLKILKSFISSPIIAAILAALLLNLTGLYERAADTFAAEGLTAAFRTAGNITTPLILLSIGCQLKLSGIVWKESVKLIAIRFSAVAAGSILLYLIVDWLVMPLDRMMGYAFLTFFLLPPPFIIPVFLGPAFRKESRFYNNLLVVYTVITLLLFTGAMLLLGG